MCACNFVCICWHVRGCVSACMYVGGWKGGLFWGGGDRGIARQPQALTFERGSDCLHDVLSRACTDVCVYVPYQELLDMLPLLDELEHAPDVRVYLGAHRHRQGRS
jgi:hypothetical protein